MAERYLDVDSPLGVLRLISDGEALCAVRLPNKLGPKPEIDGKRDPILQAAAAQLREFFAGRRLSFELPLRLEGSAFQRAAWKALQQIPFGETRSYADQARAMSKPRAVRAVGGANARNPIAIVVPCHRVIGKDGTLTGFGGGLPTKRWLLEHEARVSSHTRGRKIVER